MSKFITLVATAAIVASVPSLAQQGAPKSAAKSAVNTTAPNPAEFDKQLAQVQEQMAAMQAQMEKIRATSDPQERQKLLQQHWASMQAAMAAMHAIWGPAGGMGCCMSGGMMMGGSPMMGWGHMRGYYSSLTPEQLKQRQYMMDRYLPIQQMMMDHMMWHQQWMYPTPASAPSAAK